MTSDHPRHSPRGRATQPPAARLPASGRVEATVCLVRPWWRGPGQHSPGTAGSRGPGLSLHVSPISLLADLRGLHELRARQVPPPSSLSPLTHLTALFGVLSVNTDSNLIQSKYLLLCARNSSGERWEEGANVVAPGGEAGPGQGYAACLCPLRTEPWCAAATKLT